MSDRVLLLNMPFGGVDKPMISLGLLKAALANRGLACDVIHLNQVFAERVRPDIYQWLGERFNHTAFAGEWVFAHHYFGDLLVDGEGYLRHLREKLYVSQVVIDKLLWVRSLVAPFLDYCIRSVDWSRYSIIGFTSTFHQNLASLALAHAIKERYPDKIIVMGGANCEYPMGLALHRCFPFVDYIFSGEADDSFPEFVERTFNHQNVNDIEGLVYRDGGKSIYTGPSKLVTDLDALPLPDFDDYFNQMAGTSIPTYVRTMVQIETSRGCWWGAKHHCTFCGLNDRTLVFRSKSKDRALEEIMYLAGRYPVNQIAAVDNILDWKYFRELLPELKRRKLDLVFFYEAKANLTKEQVKLLSDAGVRSIQPGIESLNGKLLNLMRKGITPLQNVQTLKWCKQFNIRAAWNLIYGFPGENAKDYEEMLPLIKSLTHLGPPEGYGPIRLDRYSPYFDNPESFGLINARPVEEYKYLYPFPESELFNIAYFYQYEHADGLNTASYIGPTQRELDAWREAHKRGVKLQSRSTAEGVTVIEDTRPHAVQRRTTLKGWRKELYDFCDQIHSVQSIEKWLKTNEPQIALSEVLGFLERMVELKLMARDQEQYLSLAIPAPLVEDKHTFLRSGTQVFKPQASPALG
jgi:ribosomal peptide maturation radical SAM protein 1